jgi:uncharacterized protein (DUF1697 family)
METYVSMLRGINVSGHNMIKMDALKSLYESMGLRDVKAYIQSGNVVFRCGSKNSLSVGRSISEAIEQSFGFSVPVVIRRPADLTRIISKSPFAGRKGIDQTRLYVTFLNSIPSPVLVKKLPSAAAKSKDEFRLIGTEVHLHCPNGFGKTLLSNAFFEKHLNVEATTRNWKTTQTLLTLSLELAE